MAIEPCSDDSSPRISLSHDISQTNTVPVPVEQHIRSTNNYSSSSSSIDFDFCVLHQSFDLDQSSSADELFFDGKILPIEMKKKHIAPTLLPNKIEKPRAKSHKLVAPGNTCFKNEKLIETKSGILETSSSSLDDEKQNNNSKSFWNFKRSRSLNCGTSSSTSTSYARTLCPLPLLSRSNSTGSTPSVKHKQHSHKSSSSVFTGQYQKPPLRKIPSNTYSNDIRIKSVLNVPPPSFFGLGSIFSRGKEKYKKR